MDNPGAALIRKKIGVTKNSQRNHTKTFINHAEEKNRKNRHERSASATQTFEPFWSCRVHPNLGWSHYRALMRVEDAEARDFYESEAVAAGWSKRDLERQIQSQYYFRSTQKSMLFPY